jgi:hypothetical protein
MAIKNHFAEYIDVVLEIPEYQESVQIVCTKGLVKRIYNNIKDKKVINEVVERRQKEGFEVKIIQFYDR